MHPVFHQSDDNTMADLNLAVTAYQSGVVPACFLFGISNKVVIRDMGQNYPTGL
jgi:hypothetical protein